MQDCIFCKIIDHKIPSTIVFENKDMIVINDIAPKAPIHYLIMPKKHIKDVQSITKEDADVLSGMFYIAQEISKKNEKAADFKLVINSGYNAGQRVFHLHMHMLAGKMISASEI
ncbi:histidine triad nucleotide-binding protein [Candidatus Dependentiae bacterium]|nr:histidine triad nucleotide-binding protein [Candidatus Dependentiae bacterium]